MPPRFASLMRLVSCGLVITTVAFSPLNSLSAFASEPSSSVVIGEVAWAGSSLSDADEWIELWNLSGSDVPLAGWFLTGAGESGKIIILPDGAVIPANGTYLIANYDTTNAKSSLAVTPQAVTTTLSISNSNLGIELYDNLDTLIDVAGKSSTPPAGFSQPTKTSMLRRYAELDGSDASAWTANPTSANLKPDLNDIATPGICDFCSNYFQESEQITEPVQEPVPETASTSTEPTATSTQETVALETEPQEIPDNDISDTNASSTTSDSEEIILSPADATSTEPVIENQETATSTDDGIEQTTSLAPESPTPSPQPQTIEPPKPNYAMLRLNEIAPYPESGKEWVEIATLDSSNILSLSGCELHDNQGRILTIGELTLDPTVNRYLKLELSSSRLNNDGDSVSLYSPAGQLLDTITYPSLKKGRVFVRYPDLTTTWQKSDQATPESSNIMSPDPNPILLPAAAALPPSTLASATPVALPESIESDPAPLQSTSTIRTVFAETTKASAASTKITTKTQSKTATVKTATSTKSTTAKTTKTAAPKTTIKKSTVTAAKTPPIINLTFDMLNQIEDAPLRVRLQGTVGSTPGLLPYHSFILQSPEGRGLQVRVPTSRRLPPMDSEVTLVGQLYIDDFGVPYIKMGTKDLLETHGSSTGVTPRLVDLTAPSIEDVWAFMSVTGTVTQIKGRTISLDLGDAFLDVSIKQNVKYRPQRLLPGDIIRVIGLLDPDHDIPVLLPRSADDIVLVGQAKPASASDANPFNGPVVPGWTPIGAAAGAVAVTEGAKHLHRRRKQRLLEKKLCQLTKIQT